MAVSCRYNVRELGLLLLLLLELLEFLMLLPLLFGVGLEGDEPATVSEVSLPEILPKNTQSPCDLFSQACRFPF